MLLKKVLKAKAVVVLALGAVACGQNANVTRSDSPMVTDAGGALTKKPGQDVVKTSEPTPGKTAQPTDPAQPAPVRPMTLPTTTVLPGTQGGTGATGPSGTSIKSTDSTTVIIVAAPAPAPASAPSPVAAPVPSPQPKLPEPMQPEPKPTPTQTAPAVTVISGKDGKDGRDGCGIRTAQYVAYAEKLKPSELTLDELPYRSTKQHKIPTKNIGSYDGKSGAYSYVIDKQIVFKLPLSLPPREAIHHVNKAYIELSLNKVSSDGHDDTEFLCFLDERICSGRYFEDTEKSWQANINKDFWKNLNGELTDLFVSQLKAEKVGRVGVHTIWGADAFQLSLEDLTRNSNYKEVLDFLYANLPSNRRVNHKFRMVVADDTYVGSAKLVVEVEENTCKSNDLDQAK